MWRSIASVVVGFIVWSVLFVGANPLIMRLSPDSFDAEGMTDSAAMLMVYLVLSIVASVVSGWVTSRVAKERAYACCVALGVVLLAVGIAVQLQYWNAMPLWYHLAFLVMLIPGVLLGHRVAGTSGA